MTPVSEHISDMVGPRGSVLGAELYFHPSVQVTKESIFGYPALDRPLAFFPESVSTGRNIYVAKEGGVSLVLAHSWDKQILELYKLRVDHITTFVDERPVQQLNSRGEWITSEINRVMMVRSADVTYEKIAAASKEDVRNYFCSVKSRYEGVSDRRDGEGILFHQDYVTRTFNNTLDANYFDFDHGVNNFEKLTGSRQRQSLEYVGFSSDRSVSISTARSEFHPKVRAGGGHSRIMDLGTEHALESVDSLSRSCCID